MYFRIATSFLILLTIGFFFLHRVSKEPNPITIANIPVAAAKEEALIAHNEFLLLMDRGEERYLPEVLEQFNLQLIEPLEEWVHVARNTDTLSSIVPLESSLGLENLAFLAKLDAHPAVHSAHLNYIQTGDPFFSCSKAQEHDSLDASIHQITPKDPYFKYQWHLQKNEGINATEAWSITTGDPHTIIALVDRNFDMQELDWAPETCSSRKYYYENLLEYFKSASRPAYDGNKTHGSNVLSVLAPCTDNSLGLAGVDWQAQVFSVDSKYDASFSTRMLGILWASGVDICASSVTPCLAERPIQKNLHEANVINASFGFAGPHLKDPPYGPVLDVIGRINREGGIIVASAGNEGMLADRRLPGAAGGVISVSSSNKMHQSSSFSNYGRTIDVLAPGEDILGLSHGKAISLNGTSFSAPIVSGVVSLMLAVNPMLSWKQAEYILKETATPLSCHDYCPDTMKDINQKECQQDCCQGDKVICARGIVNALGAVKMAQQGIPKVALVDVDDYYLPLSEDNHLSMKLIIKNWGKSPGVVSLKPTDANLTMTPARIRIPGMEDNQSPGREMVTIKYHEMPKQPTVISLVLQIAQENSPAVFHDQIEAIVEIVPDPEQGNKNRLLKELLPR